MRAVNLLEEQSSFQTGYDPNSDSGLHFTYNLTHIMLPTLFEGLH